MTLAPDQLPNDVTALQAIIAEQAKELAEQTVALEDARNQLKARDIPACTRLAAKVGLVMPDLRRCAPADRDIHGPSWRASMACCRPTASPASTPCTNLIP